MTLFELGEAEPSGRSAESQPGTSPAPAGPVIRVRLLVAYDGSGFHGFAPQPEARTVAGVLAEALDKVVGHPVTITCAGRTDAGVHATGQVVHFDVDLTRARPPWSDAAIVAEADADTAAGGAGAPPVAEEAGDGAPAGSTDTAGLVRRLNRMLAPAVAVREASVVPATFDARHSAHWRHYRYLVHNAPVPDPLLAPTVWHVEEPLDLRSMQLACDPVHGEHDFAAVCRRPADPKATTVRRVISAGWSRVGDELLRFDIRAGSFCHQMVRSLVGTMVDVGRGRRRAGDLSDILRSRDRAEAGVVAPPHGLCLVEVGY